MWLSGKGLERPSAGLLVPQPDAVPAVMASEIVVKFLTLFKVQMRLLESSLLKEPRVGLGDSCPLPYGTRKVGRREEEWWGWVHSKLLQQVSAP